MVKLGFASISFGPLCYTVLTDHICEESVANLSMSLYVLILSCVVHPKLLDVVFFLRLRVCDISFKERLH